MCGDMKPSRDDGHQRHPSPVKGSDAVGRQALGRHALGVRPASHQPLGVQPLGLLAADGLTPGHEAGGVGQRVSLSVSASRKAMTKNAMRYQNTGASESA